MAELPHIRRLLLGLMGQEPDHRMLAMLDGGDWDSLASMASEHRLGPLLHARWHMDESAGMIPQSLRDQWRSAHRASGMAALAQRADLLATTEHLSKAGIGSAALKGAWLAWHAYPSAAMRPSRDIDLLVPQERALEAWRILHHAGYAAPDGPPDKVDMQQDKHLTLLTAPQGTFVELHMRCWETVAPGMRPMPNPIDHALLAQAAASPGSNGIRHPAAHHMLTHLAVHATCAHGFDAGPLVLSDVDFLLQTQMFDWEEYWREAQIGGWSRSTALILALTDRWRRPGILAASACPVEVPPDMLETAPDLLLQPMNARSGTQFLAALRSPITTMRNKLTAPRQGNFLPWFTARLTRTARDIQNSETRLMARRANTLADWLAVDEDR